MLFTALFFVIFVAVVLSAKRDSDPERSVRYGRSPKPRRPRQGRQFNLPL